MQHNFQPHEFKKNFRRIYHICAAAKLYVLRKIVKVIISSSYSNERTRQTNVLQFYRETNGLWLKDILDKIFQSKLPMVVAQPHGQGLLLRPDRSAQHYGPIPFTESSVISPWPCNWKKTWDFLVHVRRRRLFTWKSTTCDHDMALIVLLYDLKDDRFTFSAFPS